jgi:hypothetical protein
MESQPLFRAQESHLLARERTQLRKALGVRLSRWDKGKKQSLDGVVASG